VALKAVGRISKSFTTRSHEQKSSWSHPQKNGHSLGKKPYLTCIKEEMGQTQPQLYGTLYFFVRKTTDRPGVLAACLIPTTFVGHPYWKEENPAAKANQKIHFLKNLAMLGGLLVVIGGEGVS